LEVISLIRGGTIAGGARDRRRLRRACWTSGQRADDQRAAVFGDHFQCEGSSWRDCGGGRRVCHIGC
jgi:hypothetical protein